MKRAPSKNDTERRRQRRRRIACILRASFCRLADLDRRVRFLREWTAAAAGESPFCKSLEVALEELETMRRTLGDRSAAFRGPGAFVRIPAIAGTDMNSSNAMKMLSAVVRRLRADCEACSRRLCDLARTARAVNDAATEHISCFLLHILEKLLCCFGFILRSLYPNAFHLIPANFNSAFQPLESPAG